MSESVTYQEIVKEARDEGELHGEFKALMKILQKLGDISEDLHKKLQGINSTEKLDSLIDLALAVSSIEEFTRQTQF